MRCVPRRETDRTLALLIGQRIQIALRMADLTQTDVAMMTGTAPSIVNRWCRGASMPSAEGLIKLSWSLAVSTDFLLGLTDEGLPTLESPRDTRVDEMADVLAEDRPPRPARASRRRP